MAPSWSTPIFRLLYWSHSIYTNYLTPSIYSNQAQQSALAIQFGHTRFVYNHYRAVRAGYYLDTGTSLTYVDCATDLADIRKVDYPWLKDADSQAMQQAIKDLDHAYANFFAGRAKYPTFRSKRDTQSARLKPTRFNGG